MNKVLTMLIVNFCIINGYSQSLSPKILSTAGDSFQGTSIQLDWTLGELAITNIANNSYQITQGFHQPYYIITSIDKLSEDFGEIKVYPNPTTNWIKLDASFEQICNVRLTICDIHGKTIWTKESRSQRITDKISLSSVPSGIYFLYIRGDNMKSIKTTKIQKN